MDDFRRMSSNLLMHRCHILVPTHTIVAQLLSLCSTRLNDDDNYDDDNYDDDDDDDDHYDYDDVLLQR